MGWKCKNQILDENLNVLFEVGEIYEEQDDRVYSDDSDDIVAICLICNLGIKRYLVDEMFHCFEEVKIECNHFLVTYNENGDKKCCHCGEFK